MADNFGLKIGVEGEKEFKKALSDINSTMKVLGSEMKLVEQSDKLAVLADQAQQLHAADKKTLMLIENKENERRLSFWERRAAKKAEKKARKEQSDE